MTRQPHPTRSSFSLLVGAALVAATTLAAVTPAHGQPDTRGQAETGSHADSRSQADEDPPTRNLAPTPPMGWNSWNTFACDIDEQLIRDTADAMVASGMRDAGYEYVNIDDCWMAPERDAQGRLQPDPVRFPNGIDALADYVHARGLKLGIYSSAGTVTCQGLPASIGHEEIDAQTWADWGVDYLKYDNCGNHQGKTAQERYEAMGDALAATGRDIVFSLCEWGSNDPWLWGRDVGGHLWRTTGDITDTWSSVMSLLDQQVGLEEYSGPNAWNDPDMLEVGNPGLTYDESRAHMSLWSVLNAPLIAGNDVRDMPQSTVDMLTDPEVLAVNQDWGGIQGHKIRDDGDTEVWAKPMSDGGAAVVLLNRSATSQSLDTTAQELGLPKSGAYRVTDVWADTVRGSRGPVRANVASHGAEMFVVEPARAGGELPAAVTLGADATPYVEQGEPVDVTTTLYNDGVTAIEDAEVDLTAPEGWDVEGDGTIGTVAPGRSADATWTLTPDGSTEPGRVDLQVRSTWTWDDDPGYAAETTTSFFVVEAPPAGTSFLSDLDWVDSTNGWGPVERDQSNGEQQQGDGLPLTIAGTTYAKGLGVHADSTVTYFTGGDCTEFTADVGIDDEVGDRGSVAFEVWADGEPVAESGVVLGSEGAVPLTADLAGVDVLELRADEGTDGKNYDHADWADGQITCS